MSVGNDGIGGAVGWPRWTGDAVGLNFMQCIDVLHGVHITANAFLSFIVSIRSI